MAKLSGKKIRIVNPYNPAKKTDIEIISVFHYFFKVYFFFLNRFLIFSKNFLNAVPRSANVFLLIANQ